MNTTPENASFVISDMVDKIVFHCGNEVKSRNYRVANELQNNLNRVLRGQRHGRRYNIPGTGRIKYKKGKRVAVGYEASNYGRKGKKIYRREAGTASITYRKYTASAPGEPPANRTGVFRMSFKRKIVVDNQTENGFTAHGITESGYKVKDGKLLGNILEYGTSKMAPRPYKQKVIEKTLPKAQKIYSEPYEL